MFDALKVRMPELPEDRVLSLVPEHARSESVPLDGRNSTEAVQEEPVAHPDVALDLPDNSNELEVLWVYGESVAAYAKSRALLSDQPLGANDVGDFGVPCKRGITSR